MSKLVPIIDRMLAGEEYDFSVIDDEIDAWHESESSMPLYEWLGFTKDEYALYVESPSSLNAILAARHYNMPVTEWLKTSISTLLASLGATPEEAAKLNDWLIKTGRR